MKVSKEESTVKLTIEIEQTDLKVLGKYFQSCVVEDEDMDEDDDDGEFIDSLIKGSQLFRLLKEEILFHSGVQTHRRKPYKKKSTTKSDMEGMR